jgi:hypothetical protein
MRIRNLLFVTALVTLTGCVAQVGVEGDPTQTGTTRAALGTDQGSSGGGNHNSGGNTDPPSNDPNSLQGRTSPSGGGSEDGEGEAPGEPVPWHGGGAGSNANASMSDNLAHHNPLK